MNPIEESEKLIDMACKLFDRIPLGRQQLEQLAALKVRLHQPCELAIAGKVKAGKSSFLNVLLGADLAKVGDVETTATINRFCYGKPEFPDRPVKVVWEDGSVTFESLQFMDNLQGHDSEVMQMASRINYLEYRLEHPILKELTMVDTPGTGAVVDEHQQVADTYFNLREKHKKQTRICTSQADAVVYLMGAVPNVKDQSFLDDFRKNTEDGIPLNAIGVLSKVDVDMKLLEEKDSQAQYLAECLKEQLCTVIPVSAGLYKAVQEKKQFFGKWQKDVKSILPDAMKSMLKSEKLFTHPAFPSLPVEKRKEMKNGIPWSIFRTLVSVLYETSNPDEAEKELLKIANMDQVKEVINKYFFDRSKLIRCSRVLADLYAICLKVQGLGLYLLREETARIQKWERFAKECKMSEAKGLAEYLHALYLPKEEIERLDEEITQQLKYGIELLQKDIQQVDKDFQSLSMIQANRNLFTEEEFDEFNALFKMIYSYPTGDAVSARLAYWRGKIYFVNSTIKRQVIEHAIEKYSRFNK